MNQQNGPSPLPFPFVLMPPQGPMPFPERYPDNPPARVRVALEVLAMFTHKQMTRAAVSDIAIETLPGQELTKAQRIAEASACHLLAEWFAGKLEASHTENVLVQAMKQNLDKEGESHRGHVLRCVACNGTDSSCHFCRGSGKVIIYPGNDL